MTLLTPRPSNQDRASFVQSYGGIYEDSPWIVEAVADRVGDGSLDTAEALAEAMAAVVDQAPLLEQMKLIRAHPDLAGKAAIGGELSEASTAEQASAGLDQCTPEEFAAFEALNRDYHEKFGFPFIIAVKGKSRGDILAAFRARLTNDFEAEKAEALRQIHRIAQLRLAEHTVSNAEVGE